MKRLFAGILAASLIFVAGCSDEYNIPNPPLTKVVVINKEFIASQSFPVAGVLRRTNSTIQVYESTPEMYLISIQTQEGTRGGYKIYKRSYYKVSPMLFGELQIGQEVDFKDNKDATPADVK